MKKEKIDRSIAVRKLLDAGLKEWKEKTALKMLESGEVTFSRAAEIAGLDIWTFSKKVREAEITWVKINPEDLKKELAKL